MLKDSSDLVDYEIIETLIEKRNRKVFLVKALKVYNDKEKFIIKQFNSHKMPLEIRIHTELSKKNSNILQCFNYWKDEGFHYMLIEYCEKGDLSKFILNRRRNPEPFKIIYKKC